MVDTIFEALANEHRRRLLIELLDYDFRRIGRPSGASWEITEANEELLRRHLSSSRTIDDADETLVRLRHVHLPKLADFGFIEWDRGARVVTRGPRFEEIRPLLEFLDGRRDDLPNAYLGRSETVAWPLQRPPK